MMNFIKLIVTATVIVAGLIWFAAGVDPAPPAECEEAPAAYMSVFLEGSTWEAGTVPPSFGTMFVAVARDHASKVVYAAAELDGGVAVWTLIPVDGIFWSGNTLARELSVFPTPDVARGFDRARDFVVECATS